MLQMTLWLVLTILGYAHSIYFLITHWANFVANIQILNMHLLQLHIDHRKLSIVPKVRLRDFLNRYSMNGME